jgi:hypothetical protein
LNTLSRNLPVPPAPVTTATPGRIFANDAMFQNSVSENSIEMTSPVDTVLIDKCDCHIAWRLNCRDATVIGSMLGRIFGVTRSQSFGVAVDASQECQPKVEIRQARRPVIVRPLPTPKTPPTISPTTS